MTLSWPYFRLLRQKSWPYHGGVDYYGGPNSLQASFFHLVVVDAPPPRCAGSGISS
jgi:hypothetical protein